MTAQVLRIVEKHRGHPGMIANIADFTVSPGETIDPNLILTHPNISPYCLNDAEKTAIFVELPDGTDLSTAPFVYQMQYDRAQRLIEVSYETFRQLADTLPKVEHPILIYSSGRGGSTLMSHIFNALDNVISLSEPDAAFQFISLRHTDGSRDAELGELLDWTIRMLFKPTAIQSQASKMPMTYALKFRNEATQLMDLYQATFPGAKNLYVYRDGIGFVSSFYRLLKRAALPDFAPISEFITMFEQTTGSDRSQLMTYLDPGIEQISIPQQAALMWLTVIELYLAQHAKGIPVLAVRYADLNRSREQVISAILDYCGLPKEQLQETLHVFERDAQEGTMLARENPAEGNKLRLTEEEHAQVTRILARHPVIKESDYIVAGTLKVQK
ncbi:MAG: sulfotransferase [Chloroflexota bacterium]